MIEYKLIDSEFVVPVCLGPLTDGPLALSSIDQLHRETPFEEQFSLPSGSHSLALKSLGELYGATGIAAIDDQHIVGLIRFCPAQIKDLLGGYLCIQEETGARKLSQIESCDLPSSESMQPKALGIDCFQVWNQYQGSGIGATMLAETTAWARSNGWEELYSQGLDHILPILAWSGHMSEAALRRRGFVTIEKHEDPGIAEVALHMRQGGHGKEVQDSWEREYSHIPEDHRFHRYRMKLDLGSNMLSDKQG